MTLLAIVFTQTIYAQGHTDYPKVTLIDGDTVVIWSLGQDKENSRIIEKGFQYHKDNQLLKEDTFHLRSALRIQVKINTKRDEIIDECHSRYGREIIFRQQAQDEANHWKGEYKKEKAKSFVGKWVIKPLLFIGGAYLGYQAGIRITDTK